ncbi:MAG: hypothetical protein OXE17_03680 [Chloroflexi bacterium]|nr:hypothetical protein [Chloroflexota bacterium]
MKHKERDFLFTAGKSLLLESKLVYWNGIKFEPFFRGSCDCDYEAWLKSAFQHEYGRYISWVLFSVGMENLAKAACVCGNTVHKDSSGKYGTLGKLKNNGIKAYKMNESDPALVASFGSRWEELTSIRYDEAHAYYHETRRRHYEKLEPVLIPFSNDLVSILRSGDHFEDMKNA